MAGEDKKKGKPEGDPKPSPAPAPSGPKGWADVVAEHIDKVPGVALEGVRIGALTAAIVTPEGRGLVSSGFNVAREYFMLWLEQIMDFNSEMGARMRTRILLLFGMMLLGMAATLIFHDKDQRIPVEAILAIITVVLAALFSVQEIRWFVTVGAAKNGFSAIKPEHIQSLFRFNPFDLIFAAAPPAVSGGLGLYWIYVQIMQKIGFYGMLLFCYYMFPFWHLPWLVASGPILLFSYVILAVAYTDAAKGQLWFFWIFMTTLLLSVCLALTIFPDVADWIIAGGSLLAVALCLIVGGLVRFGVIWSSDQDRQHKINMAAKGKDGKGVATPGSNGSRSNTRKGTGWAILIGSGVVLVLVIAFFGFQKVYAAWGHFNTVTGIAPAMQSKTAKKFGLASAYPMPAVGADAITDATEADGTTGTVTLEDSVQVLAFTRSLNVQLGPMKSGVVVERGDVVTITTDVATYNAYDTQGNVAACRLDGGMVNGHPDRPTDHPDLMAEFGKFYPATWMRTGSLLIRIGDDFVDVGTRKTFTVTTGGKNEMIGYLNQPVIDEMQGVLLPDQKIPMTVTVKRPR